MRINGLGTIFYGSGYSGDGPAVDRRSPTLAVVFERLRSIRGKAPILTILPAFLTLSLMRYSVDIGLCFMNDTSGEDAKILRAK
jgi:hypothetical protein